MDFYGVYDYLWATANTATLPLIGINTTSAGTVWCAFDPFTGDYVYSITNIPGGTTVYGPHGEILTYTLDQNNGWMTMWNSSNIPTQYASTVYGSMGWVQWRPMGKVLNGTGPASVVINYGAGNVPYNSPETPLGLNGYTWNVP